MLGIPTFSFCHTIFSECNLQKTIEILKIIQNISFSQHHFDSHEIHHLPVRFTPPPYSFLDKGTTVGLRRILRVRSHAIASHRDDGIKSIRCPAAKLKSSKATHAVPRGNPVRGNRRNEILETDVQLYITVCNDTCVYMSCIYIC